VKQVESVGLRVAGMPGREEVSLKDIAERVDRSYEYVRLLSLGRKGPGDFPDPLPFTVGSWHAKLWSWPDVSSGARSTRSR